MKGAASGSSEKGGVKGLGGGGVQLGDGSGEVERVVAPWAGQVVDARRQLQVQSAGAPRREEVGETGGLRQTFASRRVRMLVIGVVGVVLVLVGAVHGVVAVLAGLLRLVALLLARVSEELEACRLRVLLITVNEVVAAREVHGRGGEGGARLREREEGGKTVLIDRLRSSTVFPARESMQAFVTTRAHLCDDARPLE
ncbi:hypothetical protein T492DRAFT_1147033 [Pavlovales sp. CCMP2436]|nr:hypothetical protein T492DRAFT_1147033 [Pavlovales sp. CCMP2436]